MITKRKSSANSPPLFQRFKPEGLSCLRRLKIQISLARTLVRCQKKKKTCQTLLLLFTIDSYKCCVAMPCIFIFEQCILASCTRLPVAIPILFPRITDVRLTSSPVCPLSRMSGPHHSPKRVKIWNAHKECLVIRAIDRNGVFHGPTAQKLRLLIRPNT